jgi:exodeoxyribonuclease VII large subunit
MSLKSNKITLNEFYNKITQKLADHKSLFKGLTISNIDGKISPWEKIYYLNGNSVGKKVTIKIDSPVYNRFLKDSPSKPIESAKYDVTIEALRISKDGVITIIAQEIRESGVSDREIRIRHLDKYCTSKGYYKRTKTALPKLISSVLALTSKQSNISDDFKKLDNQISSKVQHQNCSTSKEIASYIEQYQQEFDLVVLYRGGHEDEAMSIFSDETIIDAIMASDIPVCVALGHESDRPFIYKLADYESPTPSAFAGEIKEHNNNAYNEFRNLLRDGLSKTVLTLREHFHSRTSSLLADIEKKTTISIENIIKTIDNNDAQIENLFNSIIENKVKKIDNIEKEVVTISKHLELKNSNDEAEKYKLLLKIIVAIFISIFIIIYYLFLS